MRGSLSPALARTRAADRTAARIFIRPQVVITVDLGTCATEPRHLLIVRSVSAALARSGSRAPPPCAPIGMKIWARSGCDPVHLFGQHDPITCSELVINGDGRHSEVTARLGARELRRQARRGLCPHTNHAAELCETGGRCRCARRAPGRSRTDTGDPFRGPASSLGLRGLGHDTPAGPIHSCPGEWGEKNSPGFRNAIHAPRSANAKRYQFTLAWKNYTHSVASSSYPG